MGSTTTVLLTMLVAVILFVNPKIPILFTCLATAIFLYFSGVATAAEAFSGFSNVAVWAIIGMSMMTASFFSTGLADIVGTKLFNLTNKNPRNAIIGVYIVAAIFSTFTTSLAVLLMLGPMVDAMVAKSNGTISRKMLWMPMAIGALLGGNISLIGASNIMATSGMLEKATGHGLSFFAPATVGLPPIFIGLIFYMTIGPKIMEKVFTFADAPINVSAVTSCETPKVENLTKKAKLSAVIMVIAVFIMILNRWNLGIVTFAAAALMIVTGCCSVEESIQAVKWDVVLELAAMLGFASIVSSSGAGIAIGNFILSITNRLGLGSYGVCIVFMLMCQVMSNFMSNNADVVISVPIALSLAQLTGADPYMFGIVAVVSANSAFIAPMACPLINLTMTAGYRFSDYFRANALLNLLVFLGEAIAVYIFYYL